jgi:phospholipase A1
MSSICVLFIGLLEGGCSYVYAAEYKPKTSEEQARYDSCVLKSVGIAGEDVSAQQIKDNCDRVISIEQVQVPKRVLVEKATEDNPYVITGHRQNYILPYSYIDSPNQAPYEDQDFYPGIIDPVENEEVKLQLSIKVPLTYESLFVPNDTVYFGFTLKSFWQLYANDISSPFRETNYRPEFYYEAPIPKPLLGGTLFTRLGVEHESNGRGGSLSRSWNRVFAGVGFAKNNWGVYVQPWWRLPEDSKKFEGDPDGDDNPDISKYLGYYQVSGVYKFDDDIEFTGMGRYNWATGYGAFEGGVSFPLWGRLKGYAQYFQGYGESLIDYDYNVQRFGIGVLLTDVL